MSASLSTGSIPLIYTIGKRWWNHTTGLIAAILLAGTPLLIQLAHFYTTESILIALLLLLTLASPSPIRMAIPMGLLLATKNTSFLFLPIPLLVLKYRPRSLPIFLFVTLAVFFLASPYSFIDVSGYLMRSRYVADIVSGKLLMDWTMQFLETTPFFWVYSLLFALGPLAVIGVIGVLKKPSHALAVWSMVFFVFLAFSYLKFIRYAAPLVPFFALFGAKFLVETKRPIRYFTIGLHMLSGLMFFSVYLSPHTSLQASDWIAKNIPAGSTILVEEWNSIIRFSRPELAGKRYNVVSFNFYMLPDGEEKYNELKTLIERSDSIILESPKVKHTVERHVRRYPNTSGFYTEMDRRPGPFTKVAEFSSYPCIGPFVINDENTEETFTVFDHPTVRLYQKTFTR